METTRLVFALTIAAGAAACGEPNDDNPFGHVDLSEDDQREQAQRCQARSISAGECVSAPVLDGVQCSWVELWAPTGDGCPAQSLGGGCIANYETGLAGCGGSTTYFRDRDGAVELLALCTRHPIGWQRCQTQEAPAACACWDPDPASGSPSRP